MLSGDIFAEVVVLLHQKKELRLKFSLFVTPRPLLKLSDTDNGNLFSLSWYHDKRHPKAYYSSFVVIPLY